jgi:hypothetical protein
MSDVTLEQLLADVIVSSLGTDSSKAKLPIVIMQRRDGRGSFAARHTRAHIHSLEEFDAQR